MALLTLVSEVMPDSPLREKLGIMSLFNYLCGEDDLTGDIDYKHILKRLQNTLLQLKCMTLDGVVLTPQLIKAHLNASTLDKRGINALSSPKDKQDVKLMYDLLLVSLMPMLQTHQQSNKLGVCLCCLESFMCIF